jgi:hypothetical protein
LVDTAVNAIVIAPLGEFHVQPTQQRALALPQRGSVYGHGYCVCGFVRHDLYIAKEKTYKKYFMDTD